MDLFRYRSFSTEMMKIATHLIDADIRALLADRKGKEYLSGGKLVSNTEQETNFIPKIAYAGLSGHPDNYKFKAKAKGPANYQNVRNYAEAGLKGALTGASTVALSRGLRGKSPFQGKRGVPGLAAGTLIGAGISMADKAYRNRAEKTAGLSFTPARQLAAGRQTGRFENVIHKGAPIRAPGISNLGRM